MSIVESLVIAFCLFLFAKMWYKEGFMYFKAYSFMIVLAGVLGYVNNVLVR